MANVRFASDKVAESKTTAMETHIFNFFNSLDPNKVISLDIETEGLDRHRNGITTVQVGYITKDNKVDGKLFIWGKMSEIERFKLVNTLKLFKIITHNGKFDFLFLFEKTGVSLPLYMDTLVMAHIVGEEDLGLKDLVWKYFRVKYDVDTKTKVGEVTKELLEYGKLDAIYTLKLYRKLKELVDKHDVSYVLNHEMRAYRAYYEVEKTGVPLSDDRDRVAKELQDQYLPLLDKLNSFAMINWNSGQQIATVLFSEKGTVIKGKLKRTKKVIVTREDGKKYAQTFKTKKEAQKVLTDKFGRDILKTVNIDIVVEEEEPILGYGLGLTPLEFTDSGAPSVADDVLANYVGVEVIDLLREYRRLTKLETFIKSWEELQVNNRIYPSYNITARTGRTTCKNPNIQQIPQASSIRTLVKAPKGSKIISVDYSQAELRVASWLSGDENMQNAYRSGSDLHTSTMNLMFKDNLATDHDGAKRQRTQAKSCFTGDTYIMTSRGRMRFDEFYNLNEHIEVYGFDEKSLKPVLHDNYTKIKTYSNDIYEVDCLGFVIKVTGNHRMFVYNHKTGLYEKVTLLDIKENRPKYSFVFKESNSDRFILHWCNACVFKKVDPEYVYCINSATDNLFVTNDWHSDIMYTSNCNFGFLYGMMAKTFVTYATSYGLTITEDESAELRENFFKAYPRLLPWHRESVEFAKRYGYVVSPIGRKRFLPNIFSSDWKYRSQAERQAINSVVQGLASDMCISALADIVFSEELDHSKFNVLGSVHDAILIECKEDYAEELGQKVADIMAHPSVLEGLEVPVPFTGDVEIGDSWGE